MVEHGSGEVNDYHLVVALRDRRDLVDQAAQWFSNKWDVSFELYRESILSSFDREIVIPQWYVILNQNQDIIAGCGVIDNDFHDRPDLSPNLCALYVEMSYRKQGIARHLVGFVQQELRHFGYDILYLVTDHQDYYEKYGWQFLTLVRDFDGGELRLYRSGN